MGGLLGGWVVGWLGGLVGRCAGWWLRAAGGQASSVDGWVGKLGVRIFGVSLLFAPRFAKRASPDKTM